MLPFENRSEDKANAYFADGIQDEILTRLSKIADLKVISRTSTQQYQSKPANLREIAKQLGVANILEGSVQKVADQVRVNVQLINAQTDSHLWADTYDRKLTDIFGVEARSPKRIAESLQAKLTGREEQALQLNRQTIRRLTMLICVVWLFSGRCLGGYRKAVSYVDQAMRLVRLCFGLRGTFRSVDAHWRPEPRAKGGLGCGEKGCGEGCRNRSESR